MENVAEGKNPIENKRHKGSVCFSLLFRTYKHQMENKIQTNKPTQK